MRNARAVKLLLLLMLVSFLPLEASAYPDMVRHKYVNCTSCHVSPTGGAALSAYGRSMSKELFSRWGSEKETAPGHGFVVEPEKLPDWLIVGGNVRYLQMHRKTPLRTQGKGFLMQTEFEIGVRNSKWAAVSTLGRIQPQNQRVRPLISPRYYLMWSPQDQLAVRAGRFVPVFGINVPYHTLPTRQSLGFASGIERDTFETIWSGEDWNLGASTSQTPAGSIARDQRENLFTAQVNRNFLGHHRVGVSYLKGTTAQRDREALGVHGLLGFTEHLAYLSEFTFQKAVSASGSPIGLYHFSQLIYEATKGVHLYLIEDYQKTDLNKSSTLSHSIGPGVRFYPRPHFEVDGVFLKQRSASTNDQFNDYAWLMLHYYF